MPPHIHVPKLTKGFHERHIGIFFIFSFEFIDLQNHIPNEIRRKILLARSDNFLHRFAKQVKILTKVSGHLPEFKVFFGAHRNSRQTI